MNLRSLLPTTVPALSLLILTAPALHAQVTNIPIFETHTYRQNDPTLLTPTNVFFNARIFETNPGDATAATLTYPGSGSPGDYTQASYSPTILTYDPPSFANQAAMDAAFPTGTYTTDYTDAANNLQSISASYTQTAYASTMPTFTAATYNAMQGLDITQDFTFTFNADMPSAVSDSNFIFFDIYNSTTGIVAAKFDGQPSTLTQFTVPANTFLPGTTYNTDLNFSDRISSQSDLNSSTISGIDTTLGFDQRTGSSFTTPAAVPEASTTISFGLLMALGLGGVRMAKRKRSAGL